MKFPLSFSVFLLLLLVLQSSGLNCSPQEYPGEFGKCCRHCGPGTQMQGRCTKNADTLCQPCQEGFYNPTFSAWECTRCTTCDYRKGLGQVKKCESTSDTLCVCLPGHQPPTSNSDEKRCVPCPHGHFSKGGDTACTPWTNCTATGRAVFRAGSKEEDAICDKAPKVRPTTEFPTRHSTKREKAQFTSVTKPTSTSPTLTALQTEGPLGSDKKSEFLWYILIAAALLFGLGAIILLKTFSKTKEPGRFVEQDGKNSFRIPIQEEQIDAKSSLVRN